MNSATPQRLSRIDFLQTPAAFPAVPPSPPLSPHAHLMLTYPFLPGSSSFRGLCSFPPPPVADCQNHNSLFPPPSLFSFSRLLFAVCQPAPTAHRCTAPTKAPPPTTSPCPGQMGSGSLREVTGTPPPLPRVSSQPRSGTSGICCRPQKAACHNLHLLIPEK